MRNRILMIGVLGFSIVFMASTVSAQISGGGQNLSTPISSQLGGIISSDVFSGLSANKPKAKSPAKTPVKTPAKTVSKNTPKRNTNTGKTKNRTPVTEEDYGEEPNSLAFTPVNNSGVDRQLATSFSNKPAEQAGLIEIFRTTKTGYKNELRKMGKKEDVAMALTFFIATCVTVYNAAPEPGDAAIENVYQKLFETMNEAPQFARMSDAEKQALSDKLVYISGLVLAGYISGQQTNDANTTQAYRLLAGVCLQSLMQVDPGRMRFNQTGLVVQ